MAEPERRLGWMRWVMLGTAAMLLGIGGLALGLAHRQQMTVIAEIEDLGGFVRTAPWRPEWARDPGLDYLTRGSDPVVRVAFNSSGATRAEIERLLTAIERLPSVRTLRLERSPLTDADLERLTRLPHLESLGLAGTRITDAGLARLAALPSLRWLLLDHTAITDAGLAHLHDMPHLEMVSLERVPITDASVGTLCSLPRLNRVYLDGTSITPAGRAELHRRRPALSIR